jgi:hypothetical protein
MRGKGASAGRDWRLVDYVQLGFRDRRMTAGVQPSFSVGAATGDVANNNRRYLLKIYIPDGIG